MTPKLFVFSAAAAGILYLWERPLPPPLPVYEDRAALALFSQKGDGASKKVKELERQLQMLKKDGKPVGYDHIQRLWKELLGLWKKGAVGKTKAMALYQILSDIYWMSNPKPAARQHNAHADARGDTAHGEGGSNGDQAQVADVRQEIERIAATPGMQGGLAPAHYERLKKQLDDLAGKGVTGLERYYAMLEERSPHTVAETDKKQTAALSEQKKRRDDPYYDCPKDTPPPALTADFTDFSALKMITPPGTLTGDRDVAKGHFWIWTGGARVPIYVPVDAVLESVTSGPASAKDPAIHSTLDFKVKDPCGYTFRFGHITDPDMSLQPGTVLPAGSRVGYTVGNVPSGNWDIGFYNRLQKGELAKINAFGLHSHGVCLIDYYPLEKQQEYRVLFDPAGPHRVCQY